MECAYEGSSWPARALQRERLVPQARVLEQVREAVVRGRVPRLGLQDAQQGPERVLVAAALQLDQRQDGARGRVVGSKGQRLRDRLRGPLVERGVAHDLGRLGVQPRGTHQQVGARWRRAPRRAAARQVQRALQVRAGLARAQARGDVRRPQPVGERFRERTRLLEVHGQRHGRRVQVPFVDPDERLGRLAVPQRAALAGHGGVERVLVQRMDEAVARGGLADRELDLPQRHDQPVHALDAVEPLLDRQLVFLREDRHHACREGVTLDAARLQQPPVALLEAVDAVLQHAHEALGHVLLDGLPAAARA